MSTLSDKAVAIAQSLIRCESVTPADAGALDALAEALKPARFAVERLTFKDEHSPPIHNLFARIGDGLTSGAAGTIATATVATAAAAGTLIGTAQTAAGGASVKTRFVGRN